MTGQSGRKPLRYRAADKVVHVVKLLLGRTYGGFRTAVVQTLKSARSLKSRAAIYSALRVAIKPIPFLGPISARLARLARRLVAAGRAARTIAGHLRREPAAARRLVRSLREGGPLALLQDLSGQVPSLNLEPYLAALRFRRSRLSPAQLAALRGRPWPDDSPRFSVLMPVYNPREEWLREAVQSVLSQTYPHWQLICIDDASPAPHVLRTLNELAESDPRMLVISAERNAGVSAATNRGIERATGDYIVFMDHDDAVEPNALQAFAEAILRDRPDMLYSDEAVTAESLDRVLRVDSRPGFSYDHYLGHPYFVHLVAARTSIVRALGGLNEGMSISQDVDMNLRLIEASETVCHVPEVLYRWRTHPGSLGHRKMDECTGVSRGALERHFRRTGQRVEIEDRIHFNHRDIRYSPSKDSHVAILISPSDPRRLEACLADLNRTVDRSRAEFLTLDGETGKGMAARINEAIARLGDGYTHYLFLDDSIRAGEPGWLEHMLGFADRPDVGVVGALLINDRQEVEHAGLCIRRDGRATASHRGWPFRHWIAGRNPGHIGELLASHDVSAVTGACLLTRTSVLDELGGFDPRFATSLHDADFCLRATEAGYKVILDAYAVLSLTDASSGARGIVSVGPRPRMSGDFSSGIGRESSRATRTNRWRQIPGGGRRGRTTGFCRRRRSGAGPHASSGMRRTPPAMALMASSIATRSQRTSNREATGRIDRP